MATHRQPTVVDETGAGAHIREFIVDEQHTIGAVIQLATGTRLTLPMTLLEPHPDGGYAIRGRWRDYATEAIESVEVPVIAEHVTIDVRAHDRERVRVRRTVVEEPQLVETPVHDERLELERVAVDRMVDEMPRPRREGDLLVVPVVEEVVVIEKRLRLREELHIRIVREPRIDRQTVTLRRHELAVERTPQPTERPGDRKGQKGDHS